ncbi:rRNA maturation RNase YbeY [uncultured Methylovirgula sp.]|uniref:rRNA maturation RNase YbeY n=1 Tax=uncultured Methylovirgula sp. TaxID=1285960 RepID=UPI002618F63F|nr:rRNA maturation RNase YbeY [uncultured Methylovirgula sp.]
MSEAPLIDFVVEGALWENAPDVPGWTAASIGEAILKSGVKLKPGVEISILLTDDEAIRKLNRQWRGKDQATNVLSFPAPGEVETRQALGDIAIAYETCAREAGAELKTFQAHVTHLVVHGFLHLIGFDHETEAEALEMEALERDILAALGISDPYAVRVASVE